MTGTAAEVTPVRSVDDHRDRTAGPITREIQSAYLDTVQRPERTLGALARARPLRAPAPRRDPGDHAHPALARRGSDEREEELVLEVLRSRPALARPVDPRASRGCSPSGRRAVRGRGLERDGRAAPGSAGSRAWAGRRGDHLPVLVRRVRELLHLRGRDAGLRRHRPAHVQPRSRRGRGRDHKRTQGDRRRRHLRLPVRARPAARALRAHTASADRGRVRGARRANTEAGRSARTAPPAVFAFYPNKQITTGEGGVVTTHVGGAPDALLQPPQPGPGRRRRLARPLTPRLQLPPRRPSRRDRNRAAGEARRDPRRAAPRPRERYASCSRDVDGVGTLRADDAEHRRSWFVYVVELAAGDRPRGGDRRARGRRDRHARAYLPCIHLQAYMRERYGFREGLFPVAEERETQDARAAVPPAARAGGSGARRRDAALGARGLSANRHTFGTRRHSFVRICPAR